MARTTTFTFYHDVNLSYGSENTFYFENRSAQATFFSSKILTSASNCYYQRADINRLQVEKPYSQLYRCDYLSFINPDYENKRFYAFVTGVKYVNDTTTEIQYVIDNIQTWLLDCTIPSCYIERQHSETDDIGDSYLYDSLDCGEYIDRSQQDNIQSDTMVVFVCTFNMLKWREDGTKTAPQIANRQGIFDSIGVYCCYSEIGGSYNTTLLGQILADIYNGVGGVTVDDFINIYVYPSIGLKFETGQGLSYPTSGADSDKVFLVGGASGGQVYPGQTANLLNGPSFDQNFTDIDGYTPKNNKLFQYPYCLLHVTNNNGSALDLKFEKFRNAQGDITQAQARIFGTSTSEAKLRLVPEQYLGEGLNDYDNELGIDSGAFPTVAMTGDAFLIYLAQNKNRIETGYDVMRNQATTNVVTWEKSSMDKSPMGVGSLPGSVASGGALYSGFLNQIATNMAQMEDLAIAPNTASGLSGVGLSFQNGKKNFTQVVKTIDKEHAEMIDNYYTLYGYPVKRLATPVLKARTGFTYIKTIGCIIKGNVPETAKSNMENMFNNGIRFWADISNFGDYSITNSIITPTP